MVVLLCAAFASAEKSKTNDDKGSGDTFKDCLEDYGDTACKPMRDKGNMNSACVQAVADCSEKSSNDESEDESSDNPEDD